MVEAPEQTAPGVYSVDTMGLSNAISVLLVRDNDGWALGDTGVRSSSLRIQEALAALGAEPSELKRIYLTHHCKPCDDGQPRRKSLPQSTKRKSSLASVSPIPRRTCSSAFSLAVNNCPRRRSIVLCVRAIALPAFV